MYNVYTNDYLLIFLAMGCRGDNPCWGLGQRPNGVKGLAPYKVIQVSQ